MASDNHDYSNVSKTIELDFDRNDLAFAKSAEVKPFIYSIELNESISSSFDAKLVIYLKKKLKASDLRAHLQEKAYITLRQVREDGVELRSQNIFGMVTGYRSMGLISQSTELNNRCYKYELTVQSILSRLSINRKNCTYQGTVSDVISEVLSKYEDSIQFDFTNMNGELEDLSFKDLVFSQTNESDLAFINRLCGLFGINYTLTFNTDSKLTTVCFSKNWDNKVNLANPKKNTQKTEFTNTPPSGFTEFLIDSAEYHEIFDECSIFDDNTDKTKREYQFELVKLSTLGIRGLEDDAQKLNEIDLKKHFENSIKNTESKLVAVIYDIGYTPGLIPEIDNIEDCGAPDLKFIVVGRSLKFRQKFSNDFLVNDNSTEKDFMLKQVILAVPVDSQRLPGSFNKVDSVAFDDSESNICSVDGINPVLKTKLSDAVQSNINSGISIMEATVIDRPDSVSEVSDTELQSVFYATVDSYLFGTKESDLDNKYITVQLFKVNSELAYKLPRKGQKVLVIHSDGRFYLLGVMSNGDGRSIYSKSRKKVMQDSSILTVDDKDLTLDDDLTSYDIDNNVAGFFKFDTPNAFIEHLFYQNRIRGFASVLDSEYNITSFTNKWDADFAAENESLRKNLVSCRADYSEKQKNYRNKVEDSYQKGDNSSSDDLLNEFLTSKDSLNSCINDVTNFVEKVVAAFDEIELYDESKGLLSAKFKNDSENDDPLTNYTIDADDYVLVNSKSSMVLSGKKIDLSSEEDFCVDVGNEVCFKANKKISFEVGQSRVEITDKGIDLIASKYGNESGLMCSKLSLDGIYGATLYGDNVTVKGLEYVSIGDAFGAGLSLSGGSSSLTGIKVDLSTMGAIGFITKMISQISTLSNTLTAIDTDNKWVKGITKFIGSATAVNTCVAIADAVQLVKEKPIYKIKEISRDSQKHKKIEAVQLALDTVVLGLEMVMAVQNAIMDATLDTAEAVGGNVDDARETMRNINMVEWLIKYAAMLADMIVSYSAHSGFTSSISLVPEEITLDTKCKKDAQNVAMKVKSVEAGSPFNIVIG